VLYSCEHHAVVGRQYVVSPMHCGRTLTDMADTMNSCVLYNTKPSGCKVSSLQLIS
jgi:hypothetical protein